MITKLRVGVLMGGQSIEHEVSFNSGRTICDHLDTQRYEVIPLYQTKNGLLYVLPWHFLHRGKTTDFSHRLQKEALHISYDQLPELIDFMYLSIHGWHAEDGTIQGVLEVLQIPYLGTKIFGSSISLNKVLQKEILQQYGIQTPNGIVYMLNKELAIDQEQLIESLQIKNLNLPLIIKPAYEGSSLGVSVVWNAQELADAIKKAACIDAKKTQPVLIEENIEGMEFCCIVITDYRTGEFIALPITEIIPEKDTHVFDYEQKYMPGRSTKITPARCSQKDSDRIQQVCIATIQALEFCTVARIDGFLKPDGTVVIIEANSTTGTAPSTFLFQQAACIGMNHTKLINHLIETELHQYGILEGIEKREQEEIAMNNFQKLRVAVLLGGASNEREISLESGRNVVYKLSPQKYEPFPVFLNKDLHIYAINDQQLVFNSTKQIEASLLPEQKIQWADLPEIADFVFIALHGGIGENGCAQGMLETLGLPYNGSSIFASALCMNKFKTNSFLRAQGFDVPDSLLISAQEWQATSDTIIQTVENNLGFPCIIKPHDDGCSVGVSKINAAHELAPKLQEFFMLGKQDVMIEQAIAGMELTVGVIGNNEPKALVPSQAVCTGDILSIEEKFLPGQGENQTPAPLPEEALILVQKTMEKAYKAIGCKGYVRIDCFYQTAELSSTGTERVVILEVNTLPALTPATCLFHQAAEEGIRPMDLIDTIVTLGLEEHSKERFSQKDTSKGQVYSA